MIEILPMRIPSKGCKTGQVPAMRPVLHHQCDITEKEASKSRKLNKPSHHLIP